MNLGAALNLTHFYNPLRQIALSHVKFSYIATLELTKFKLVQRKKNSKHVREKVVFSKLELATLKDA